MLQIGIVFGKVCVVKLERRVIIILCRIFPVAGNLVDHHMMLVSGFQSTYHILRFMGKDSDIRVKSADGLKYFLSDDNSASPEGKNAIRIMKRIAVFCFRINDIKRKDPHIVLFF